MEVCGRLVARKGEQDVDRHIAAGIEVDGGAIAPAMGDLVGPPIDDSDVAARKIGPDVGRNVVIRLVIDAESGILARTPRANGERDRGRYRRTEPRQAIDRHWPAY